MAELAEACSDTLLASEGTMAYVALEALAAVGAVAALSWEWFL